MPDSCNSCGLCSEPAARITSRAADTRFTSPPLPILDAGRAPALEHDARGLRIHYDGAGSLAILRAASTPPQYCSAGRSS